QGVVMKVQACAKGIWVPSPRALRFVCLRGLNRAGFQGNCLLAIGLVFLFLCFLIVPSDAQEKRKDLGDFNLTLVGDNIIFTPAAVRQNNPRFMAAVDEIRKGDAAFANLETTFAGPDAYPAGAPRTENLFADPAVLK